MSLGEFLPSSSTKLCLHLNGNSNDSSSSGNNGTDSNITYGLAYGKLGQGASFNGSNSKLLIVDNTFGWTTNGTVSLWIYTSSTNNRTIVFGNLADKGVNIQLFSSKIYARLSNEGFTNDPDNLPQNSWNLLTFTWEGTISRKLYLNGVLKVTKTSSLANPDDNGLKFGVTENDGTFFAGNLDEVIVENRAWTAEQVKKYHTYSKGRFGII